MMRALITKTLFVLSILLSAQALQASVIQTMTNANGLTLDGGSVWSHAHAGGREAFSLIYSSCSNFADTCYTHASASASNDYVWNMVVQPGYESLEVPLNISYFVGVGSSAGGAASASVAVQGQKIANLSSTLGTINQSGSAAISVNAGSQINIRLETSVLNNGTYFPHQIENWSSLVWALADPIVTIDPTWEFASNFSLEEVLNPMQSEVYGVMPAGLDLGEIPTNLVGVVPVPAAVWLFGSALGLLGWIRRKQSV
jgi:hypothetical protein